jgi:glycerophosphoryl diester phosphodiesterase
MVTLLNVLPRQAIFAHRGASAYAPENTLAAFRLAVAQGADGIELDAKLSADGHVVVIHDPSVDRTTGARGLVRQMPLEQLRALDAGSFFDPKFAGEPIPTLDAVFAEVGVQTFINVEMTNYASPNDGLPDAIADLVIRHGLQERVFFSSFHPLNLLRIRRRLPKTPVAMLALPGAMGALQRGWLGRWFAPELLHPYFSDISPRRLQAEHRRGRRVNAWTVNEAAEMRRLWKFGIDGIITDDPLLARTVLEEK